MQSITLSTRNAARLTAGVAAARSRHCPVCGFAELQFDAVALDSGESGAPNSGGWDHLGREDRGWENPSTLLLTECPHCESRWTSCAPDGEAPESAVLPARCGDVRSVRARSTASPGVALGRIDGGVASAA